MSDETLSIWEKFTDALVEHIEGKALQVFETKKKVPTKEGGKGFWISSSEVGGCQRKSYFNAKDPIQSTLEHGTGAGNILRGRVLHFWLEDLMKDMFVPYGRTKTEDLFWNRKVRLSGSLDFVGTAKDKGVIVIDVKTKTLKSFEWGKKNGFDEGDVWQVQAYLRHMAKPSVPWRLGGLLYVDGETLLSNALLKCEWVMVEPDDDRVDEWLDVVEKAWEAGEPPDIPEGMAPGKPPCAWCVYCDARCFGEGYDPRLKAETLSNEPKTAPIEESGEVAIPRKVGW